MKQPLHGYNILHRFDRNIPRRYSEIRAALNLILDTLIKNVQTLISVDGQWTVWSSWCGCSVTCGSGQKLRERTCSNPGPSNGGSPCHGTSLETAICHAITCPGT